MADAAITTSIVINFIDPTGTDSPTISAEVDSRPAVEGGYNAGKSQFVSGDSPVFLLFKETDIEVVSVETTVGTVSLIAADQILTGQDQVLTFAKASSTSLSKPVVGTPIVKFLAGWVVEDGSTPTFTVAPSGKVAASKECLAVIKVSYEAPFVAYRLSGVPSELEGEKTFPVLIVITAQRRTAV